MGQIFNPKPVPGFRAVIELRLGLGFSTHEIRQMTRENACRPVGIAPPENVSYLPEAGGQ